MMMMNQQATMARIVLCAFALVGAFSSSTAFAQADPDGTANGKVVLPARTASARPPHRVSRFTPTKVPENARKYYLAAWGIDQLKVSSTQSGNLIRFSYRVEEPQRAKALADKSATPALIGQRSRAVLQVPVMDKVGPLRQAVTPQAGQEYWMVFSNKGNLIKPGDRVNVVIGAFHADGLMVE